MTTFKPMNPNPTIVRPKIAISFSGGRTSAVMTKLLFEQYRETHDLAVCFANTGCEHSATLDFVNECDKHFGWGVVWLEAVVNPDKGKGIRHKKVDHQAASRNGEPFEAVIAKHGLPGPGYHHCTRALKEEVISSYLRRELSWDRREYWTAIGIRADELDRLSENRLENRWIYPLVKAGWTKCDVGKEVASWPFDLKLPGDHLGNCTWCWKKSLRKLATVAKDYPEEFDFPKRMEQLYSGVITGRNDDGGKRFLFRGRRTVSDLKKIAKDGNFLPYSDPLRQAGLFDFGGEKHSLELDTGSACGESCEIGAD